MDFGSIVALVVGGSGVWLWLVNMRAREIASGIAVETCRQNRAQFLDATVALDKMRPARTSNGNLKFRRTYRFEYSVQDGERHPGYVTMLGTTLELLEMGGQRWIMN